MNFPLIASGVLAALVGAAIGWLLAVARTRGAVEERLQELTGARAAAESSATELRRQVETLRAELAGLQQQLQGERAARASAETAHAKSQENLTEQKRLLEEAEVKLRDAFRSLAAEALQQSSGEFLKLADQSFRVLRKEAEGELSERQTAIEGMVKPLSQSVELLRQEVVKVENSRQEAYGELRTQVQQLAESNQLLRQETGSLVTSLRQPHIKGKWGELFLRRAAELAGMVPHCDFTEQLSVETAEGRSRPDMVVHLPGGRQIVVDAKVPLHAFLKVSSCRNQDEYHAVMTEHARLVRSHVVQLSSKMYWQQFSPSPEFVVLFLPAESYFSAALEEDHELIEDAMREGVVLASPTTLLALLKAIAYGWNQQKTAEDVQRIAELGRELHERLVTFLNHLNRVSRSLESAFKAFNEAAGSSELRLMPSARKLRALAAPGGEEVPPLAPVETLPRQISVPPETEE